MPHSGDQPTTQACALTGNRTSNPFVRRLALDPLDHTSQGYYCVFDSRISFFFFSYSFHLSDYIHLFFYVAYIIDLSIVIIVVRNSQCDNSNICFISLSGCDVCCVSSNYVGFFCFFGCLVFSISCNFVLQARHDRMGKRNWGKQTLSVMFCLSG